MTNCSTCETLMDGYRCKEASDLSRLINSVLPYLDDGRLHASRARIREIQDLALRHSLGGNNLKLHPDMEERYSSPIHLSCTHCGQRYILQLAENDGIGARDASSTSW